jgi:16S rRNA (uracil1498-N3)-methyltransferase
MRLHRFYTTQELHPLLTYKDEQHIHQWKNVFRYEVGQNLVLFGDGCEHVYSIESINKKEAVLCEQSKEPSRMQAGELALGIALIKRDNFELVLQKCTEIGVTEFTPLITDRSLQKMFGVERLEKILVEATEQSGWGRVPKLSAPIHFDKSEVLNTVALDQSGTTQTPVSVDILLVGPEGGWSDEEKIKMTKNKTKVWSLKTGVLRAETAAIVATGIILS